MTKWLKMVGAADENLTNDWLRERDDILDVVRFPTNKRPSGVSKGDLMVLYAASWQVLFGIAVVESDDPIHDPRSAGDRWPWTLDVKIPLAVPRLELAPALDVLADVKSTSVRQQSHIHLSDEDYALAVRAFTAEVQP